MVRCLMASCPWWVGRGEMTHSMTEVFWTNVVLLNQHSLWPRWLAITVVGVKNHRSTPDWGKLLKRLKRKWLLVQIRLCKLQLSYQYPALRIDTHSSSSLFDIKFSLWVKGHVYTKPTMSKDNTFFLNYNWPYQQSLIITRDDSKQNLGSSICW